MHCCMRACHQRPVCQHVTRHRTLQTQSVTPRVIYGISITIIGSGKLYQHVHSTYNTCKISTCKQQVLSSTEVRFRVSFLQHTYGCVTFRYRKTVNLIYERLINMHVHTHGVSPCLSVVSFKRILTKEKTLQF